MNTLVVTGRGLVEKEWVDLINIRERLLTEADILVNTALDKGVDAAVFRKYRQALRDIPQKFKNAQDVVWPTKPQLSQS